MQMLNSKRGVTALGESCTDNWPRYLENSRNRASYRGMMRYEQRYNEDT